MGTGCDKYGIPGDRYRPPNGLAPDVESMMAKAEPDHFGKVVPVLNLPDPPTDPAAIQAELATLRGLQQRERAAQMPAIMDENAHFGHVFERVIGIDGAPAGKKVETSDLMSIVSETAKFWIVRKKHEYNRARPVQLAPDLAPPFCPGHAAYPSGHAGQSLSMALALTDALDGHPRLHAILTDTAIRIAWRREVAGVHYPSDSECGRMLARQLLDALRADRGYRWLVGKARAELNALLGG